MNKIVSLCAYLFASLVICLFCTTTFAHPSNLDNYKFLVYSCNTNQEIVTALPILGINNFDIRDPNNPVTEADLASHDVLIVGWNDYKSTNPSTSISGLVGLVDPSDPNSPLLLENGITGNILLTGHDVDYHTCSGPDESRTLFSQMIGFALEGGGCGLICLADHSSGFSWLPDEWGISANKSGGEYVTSFADPAITSGIYSDLTPSVLSGWKESYHCNFTGWGSDFKSFESSGPDASSGLIISIGKTISPKIEITLKDNLENNPNATVLPDGSLVYTIEYKNVSGQTL